MRKAKTPTEAAKTARRRRPLAIVHRSGQFGPVRAEGWNDRLRDTFGTASQDFAKAGLAWLMATQRPDVPPDILATKTNGALAAVDAMRPRDELEAMLAVQMATTHDLAVEALGNARRQGSDPEAQVATRFAIDILQTFTRQVEALATLRRMRAR
jgi:hypothetical protein